VRAGARLRFYAFHRTPLLRSFSHDLDLAIDAQTDPEQDSRAVGAPDPRSFNRPPQHSTPDPDSCRRDHDIANVGVPDPSSFNRSQHSTSDPDSCRSDHVVAHPYSFARVAFFNPRTGPLIREEGRAGGRAAAA
jgi:hypothetical protein